MKSQRNKTKRRADKSYSKEQSSDSKKTATKKKKKLKKVMPAKKEETQEIDISMDLSSECPKKYRPLRLFVDDKTELIEELFKTIQGSDLQEMIPKALKNYSIAELKQMCLSEVESMSKGRILHILSGMDSELYVEEVPVVQPSSETSAMQGKPEADSALVPEEIKRVGPLDQEDSQSSTASADELELYPTSLEVEGMDSELNRPDVPMAAQLGGEKADLELLELEMRARAIRSLLKARGLPSSDEENDDDDNSAKK